MSAQRILQLSDPRDAVILRSVARPVPVENIRTVEIVDLILTMGDTLDATPGCGLAAPQIGKSVRIIMVQDLAKYMEGIPEHVLRAMGRVPFERMVLINPVYSVTDDELVYLPEGCLSYSAEVLCVVPRPFRIHVYALNELGERIDFEATGMQARILMHEIDHLNGVCIDVSALKDSIVTLEKYRAFWRFQTPEGIKNAFYQAA
jgi:peptide deformylase